MWFAKIRKTLFILMKLNSKTEIQAWFKDHRYQPDSYTIHADLSVSVHRDLSFEAMGFSEFPFQIIEVEGNFNCSRNQLKSLVGGPLIVTQKYDCSRNELSSIKGIAKGICSIACSGNKITSLEGFPEVQSITAVDNLITTTRGCPPNVNVLHLGCNQIDTLEDLPVQMDTLILQDNHLTSLKGAPKIVHHFNCATNPLKTLEYSPLVLRSFLFHDCEVESIEHLKLQENSNLLIFAHHNRLTSFKLDIPIRSLSLFDNPLTDIRTGTVQDLALSTNDMDNLFILAHIKPEQARLVECVRLPKTSVVVGLRTIQNLNAQDIDKMLEAYFLHEKLQNLPKRQNNQKRKI